ncbi:uncharacterized protein LOC116851844 isoform X2 [Odontomachus brunneus]|uniref:uncharacterized protein LOC116851844 isoform X2 n=1 Tax=Odontomachus brunneus TaxID=486640 RepID=UPI0013F28311|nr:uncharacterized protein LOC116851844 isoform X2 [Odontomachus brunneus]
MVEDGENGKIIIGGDFNIRIGGLKNNEMVGEREGRRSKDKMIGKDGRRLIEWVQEKGWYVLNGDYKGDWEGEFTYVGARGNTVIDYVIVSEEIYCKAEDFVIGGRIESDHMPLELRIEEEEEDEERRVPKGGEEENKEGGGEKEFIS